MCCWLKQVCNRYPKKYLKWKHWSILHCISYKRKGTLFLATSVLGVFNILNYCCFSPMLVCLPAGQKNHWSEPYMPYKHRLSNRLHPKLVFNPVSGEPDQTDSGQTPAANRHAVCWLPFTPTVFRSDRFCFYLIRFVQTILFLKMVISLFVVSLTNFIPRLGFLHPDLPVMLETFCKYPSHTICIGSFRKHT